MHFEQFRATQPEVPTARHVCTTSGLRTWWGVPTRISHREGSGRTLPRRTATRGSRLEACAPGAPKPSNPRSPTTRPGSFDTLSAGALKAVIDSTRSPRSRYGSRTQTSRQSCRTRCKRAHVDQHTLAKHDVDLALVVQRPSSSSSCYTRASLPSQSSPTARDFDLSLRVPVLLLRTRVRVTAPIAGAPVRRARSLEPKW